MMTQPSTTMMKIVTFFTYKVFDEFHYLKGTESAMGPRWPVHYFFPFEKRLPQPEIKCTRRIHKDIRYNLAKCSIRSSIFYRKPLFEQTLTHPMTLFYHIWLKTVSKGTWTEEVRNLVGAGRVKSPSFSKIIKEMNQQHWRTNNRFIYVWKIKLSRPWTFDNDSCRLCIIFHLYWWSNSEVFVDVWHSWTKPSVNSQWYIEKWVLWCGLASIITITACN